jgi:hypothetical protein
MIKLEFFSTQRFQNFLSFNVQKNSDKRHDSLPRRKPFISKTFHVKLFAVSNFLGTTVG